LYSNTKDAIEVRSAPKSERKATVWIFDASVANDPAPETNDISKSTQRNPIQPYATKETKNTSRAMLIGLTVSERFDVRIKEDREPRNPGS
jgi:hypothetical protein